MNVELLLWILTAVVGGIGMAGNLRRGDEAPARDHPLRAQIVGFLKANPGTSITELSRVTKAKWGTLQHHLYLLGKAGAVHGVIQGRERRLFVARRSVARRDAAGIALLRRGRVREVVDAIRRQPGIIQRQITASISMSRKMVREYVTLLSARGLVEEKTVARSRVYYPTPQLESLVEQLDEFDRRSLSSSTWGGPVSSAVDSEWAAVAEDAGLMSGR
jgi:predicted transcriptional regulator